MGFTAEPYGCEGLRLGPQGEALLVLATFVRASRAHTFTNVCHVSLPHRFWGLNIGRMLGDRFLKEQDVGFTAEPYVSEGLRLGPQDEALLVLATDGLWDVVSQERAAALAAKAAAAAAAAAGGGGGAAAAAGVRDEGGEGSSSRSNVGGAGARDQQQREGGGGGAGGHSQQQLQQQRVAGCVADALMQAALRLHSKDDISIMVLHVLPAAVADEKRVGGGAAGEASASGSM